MAEIDIERTRRGGADAHVDTLSTRLYSRINWGAVIAGLVVTLALQFVLYLAGIGTGLAALDIGESASGLGIGAAIWAILVPLIALFIGGMTTGRLAGVLSREDGFLHGVLTWALSLLVGVWLLGQGVGAIFGTTFRVAGDLLGATAGAVASGVGAAAGNVDLSNLDAQQIQNEIRSILAQTGDPALSPDSLQSAVNQAQSTAVSDAQNEAAVQELATLVQSRAGAVDRQDVLNVLVARTDLSQPEAERLADRVVTAGQGLRTRAAEFGQAATTRVNQATDVAAGSLWLALLGLGLSLGAAVAGALKTATE